MTENELPPLPARPRIHPGRVLLWVWAIAGTFCTLIAVGVFVFGGLAFDKANQTVSEIARQSACGSYWTFLADARDRGLTTEQIQSFIDEYGWNHGATVRIDADNACGSVDDVLARLPAVPAG